VRGWEPGPLFCAVLKNGRLVRDPQRQLQGLSGSAVWAICKERGRKAGILPPAPHDLRRTWTGDLLEAGVDLAALATADPEQAADQVQIGELQGHGLGTAQTTGVEEAQASTPRDGVLAMADRVGCPYAGLQQAPQLVGGEVAAAGLGLAPHRLHVNRQPGTPPCPAALSASPP
jgi:hypothetical protein